MFNNWLALRIGYKSLFLADSEEGLTFGVGLIYHMIGNVAAKWPFYFPKKILAFVLKSD